MSATILDGKATRRVLLDELKVRADALRERGSRRGWAPC